MENIKESMLLCLQSVLTPGAMLSGLHTVGESMKDEDVRMYLGHALLHEIVPCVNLSQKEAENAAAEICGILENREKETKLSDLAIGAVTGWKEHVLPFVKNYEKLEFELPPCLCFSLSALMMLFAGIRGEEDGKYQGVQGEEKVDFSEKEEILRTFSRLSCDMAPENLAYAVLADQEIWEEDLREIPGLEDKITEQLRDLQLLGLRATMEKTWAGKYA